MSDYQWSPSGQRQQPVINSEFFFVDVTFSDMNVEMFHGPAIALALFVTDASASWAQAETERKNFEFSPKN